MMDDGNCWNTVPEKACDTTDADDRPRTSLKRKLQVVAEIALVAGLVVYLWSHPEEVARLGALSWIVLGITFLLRLGVHICTAWSTWWLLRENASKLGAYEYFLVSASGFSLGLIAPPGSGYAYRTTYLKAHHKLSHREFLSVTFTVALISLGASGFLGSIVLLIIYASSGTGNAFLSLLGAATFLGPLTFLLGFEKFSTIRPLQRLCSRTAEHSPLRKYRNRIRAVICGMLMRTFLSFLGFGLLFDELHSGGFLMGGAIDCLSAALQLIRVVPGNIGLYEWCVAALGNSFGIPLSTGVLAAALYRILGVAAVTSSALACRVFFHHRLLDLDKLHVDPDLT